MRLIHAIAPLLLAPLLALSAAEPAKPPAKPNIVFVLILGDNGTAKGMTARFQGRNVKGGKGTSTQWGTHVPCIGNWPGHFASGKVSPDLIGAVDVLPTLCEAAGVTVPADLKIDGRSFLPQLRGEKGTPRDLLYCWYNSAGGAKAQFEFAHDDAFKLYMDGRFFNVQKDDLEKSPLKESGLDANAKAATAKLQAALKQYKPTKEADEPLDNGYGLDGADKKRAKKNQ